MLNREEYNATFHHDLTQEEFDKLFPITLDGSNAKTIESLSLVDKETKEVAEFVRIVRCKDCVEYRDTVGACHYFNYDPTDELDFCSHGVRREEEKHSETVTPENETV